jgi:peptide/nickel transport system permease protein
MTYVLGRVATSLLVLVGVSLVVFMLVHLVPGDPVQVMYGTRVSAERIAEIRASLGFDDPLPVQFTSWAGKALRGDLGNSVVSGRPIAADLRTRFGVTAQLALLGALIALAVGIPLGIHAAVRDGGAAGVAASSLSLLGIAVPGFLVATLLVYVFSLQLGWLPALGYVPPSAGLAGNLRHLVLPAVSVSLIMVATMTRMTRAAMLEVLGSDFTRTARAKGLPEGKVLLQALKAVLATILTMGGIEIAKLLGGTLIIEKVFVLPGIGTYTIDAIFARDYPVVQATVLLTAAIFVVTNIVVDVLHAALDPRVSLGRARS